MASWALVATAAYVLSGAIFAGCFVLIGVQRVDPAARSAHWTFRVILLPGAALLWPFLAISWLRVRRGGGAV